MIKPQAQGFANLIHQLHRDRPQAPPTRLVNMAAVALGSLWSKSLQGGPLITALPVDGARDSLKTRGPRVLKNEGVTVELSYPPLAQRLLPRVVTGDARWQLTLDRPEGGAFHLWYVGVGWRGRALPLRWRMVAPGASSFAEQKEVLAGGAGGLPPGAPVLLLGDREFGTGGRAPWALQQGWGMYLRWRAHEEVRRAGALHFARLPLVLPGERRVWSHVACTPK